MHMKLLVSGHDPVLKRHLLTNFKEQEIAGEYLPTVIENFIYSTQGCKAEIWDTSGMEDFSGLRRLHYLQSDVVLLPYSENSSTSLKKIPQYYAEIRRGCSTATIILVAVDRNVQDISDWVDAEEGSKLAKEWNVPLLKCNINHLNGINRVFESAIEIGLKAKINREAKEAERDKKIQQGLQLWQGQLEKAVTSLDSRVASSTPQHRGS